MPHDTPTPRQNFQEILDLLYAMKDIYLFCMVCDVFGIKNYWDSTLDTRPRTH